MIVSTRRTPADEPPTICRSHRFLLTIMRCCGATCGCRISATTLSTGVCSVAACAMWRLSTLSSPRTRTSFRVPFPGLIYGRTNHDNIHVHGYKEEGTIIMPFDMTVLNDPDRLHPAMGTRPCAADRETGVLHESRTSSASTDNTLQIRTGHAGKPRLEMAEGMPRWRCD